MSRYSKKILTACVCLVVLAVVLCAVPCFTPLASAESIGDYEYTSSSGTVRITGYTGSGTEITVPSEIDGNPVTAIGTSAFQHCTLLVSVTIPDTVISIGDTAFSGCTALESVTIPDSVTSIGSCAFEDCDDLTGIVLPSSMRSIGKGAFQNCYSLENVVFFNGITEIGDYAFRFCTSLESITLPATLESIGCGAFSSCDNLDNIYYMGSGEQWAKIDIADDNSNISQAEIHLAVFYNAATVDIEAKAAAEKAAEASDTADEAYTSDNFDDYSDYVGMPSGLLGLIIYAVGFLAPFIVPISPLLILLGVCIYMEHKKKKENGP